jgi:chorismate dehydratase
MRIGAVNYLNSKPLVYELDRLAPEVELLYDLPSRLADSLAAGRLDVALIPSVELFRGAGYAIVSDACVACRGPVLSVKLHFRVPPADVRLVALDEGSRTSSALAQILLAELHGAAPCWETLPIGSGAERTTADAVLLIGDRAITCREANGAFREVWDLGEVWRRWTSLPFVFAMWVARQETDASMAAAMLAGARDQGLRHLAEIAAFEAAALEIPVELATTYLRNNLHFELGARERQGLSRFYELCVRHHLAPAGLEDRLGIYHDNDCATR